jgi:hypothetical protein
LPIIIFHNVLQKLRSCMCCAYVSTASLLFRSSVQSQRSHFIMLGMPRLRSFTLISQISNAT